MIYRDGVTMIYDTGVAPNRAMKNILTICKLGEHPDNIKEELKDVKQLAKLERIEDPDPAWRAAFGLPERVPKPTESRGVAPKRRSPRRVKRPEVVEEVEVIEVEENQNLIVFKVVMRELWGHGVLSVMMAPIFIPITIFYLVFIGLSVLLDWVWPDEDTVGCSVKVAR